MQPGQQGVRALKDAESRPQATLKPTKPHRPLWARFVHHVIRESRKRKSKKQPETVADRAARRTASATIAIAVLTLVLAIVNYFQWHEIHAGGIDTHNLAVAAGNQATWTQRLATNTDTESGYMKDLAAHMQDQADQTKTLAGEAKTQAAASKVAAIAAKSAAETAKEALHISERAYLTLGFPANDFQNHRMEVAILNGGHIPSGPAMVVTHEATFAVRNVTENFVPLSDLIESHWQTSAYPSIPVVQTGGIYQVDVNFPKLVQAELNEGKQKIVTVIVITYNDGFPRTPKQSWIFCDQSTFAVEQKLLTMRPCDSGQIIQTLLVADHYPDPRYEQK